MDKIYEEIGVRSIARLLAKSIDSGGKYSFDKSDTSNELIMNLRKFPKRTIGGIYKDLGWSHNKSDRVRTLLNLIEKTSPELFSVILSWNVFGCERSTDVDVAVLVTNVYIPILSTEKDRLIEELGSVGYDSSKPLDLSLISIDEKNIPTFKKGGKEIHNMMLYTYNLHPQKYPLFLTYEVKVDYCKKTSSIVKYILDNLKLLTDTDSYEELRNDRISVYDGGHARIEFVINVYERFIKNPHRWNLNVWKSLLFKYIQLVVLYTGIYDESDENKKLYFRKKGVIQLLKKYMIRYHPEKAWNLSLVEKILMREKLDPAVDYVDCIDLIDHLHERFSFIVRAENPVLDWEIQKMNIKTLSNPTPISDELYQLYLESCIEVNDGFCEEWCAIYGDDTVIDAKFQEELINVDCDELASHPEVVSNTHFIKQRCPEWKELLKFYSCGKNTGVKVLPKDLTPKLVVKRRSNLLMGCIGECIVASGFDFTKMVGDTFKMCTVGIVVTKKGEKGAMGSSPDGLLVSHDEIIPVEYKTIHGEPNDNQHYKRGFHLAKKQVEGCGEILNHCKKGVCRRGIIVLTWVYEDDGVWNYDSHGGFIEM